MSPTAYFLCLSPFLMFAGSFWLHAPRARRLARWVSVSGLIALVPALALAFDCSGGDVAYSNCGNMPQSWVTPIIYGTLSAAGIWVITAPVFLGVIGYIEWWGWRADG